LRLTFIDAGVLIAAFRGEPSIAYRALEILDDPERLFVSSIYRVAGLVVKSIHQD